MRREATAIDPPGGSAARARILKEPSAVVHR